MRRLVLNLALMIGSLLLALVLAELLLRWTGYHYKPLKIVNRNLDRRSFHVFEDEHFAYDAELIWRPRASYDIFNAQGFRGSELPPVKPDDAFWIFAIGDSNTAGWRVPGGANWPGSVHALLQAACPGFQVVNAGVWGYSSHQGLILLKRILEYDPDLVLASFGANDAHLVRIPDRQYGAGSAWSGRIEKMLEPFHLGRLVLGTSRQLAGIATDEPTHRVSLQDYRQNLREIVRLAQAESVVVVFLTRPYKGPMPKLTWWKSFGHDYNAATAEIAEELEVPLIDLYAHFKDRDDFFADESHFTEEGHALAAEIVLQRLQPWIRGAGGATCAP